MTCVKCAWKVQRGESCENLRAIRWRSFLERAKVRSFDRQVQIKSQLTFSHDFPKRIFSHFESCQQINMTFSAYTRIFQLWQPHSVWQLIMQTNIQRTQSTAMLPWRLPGDKKSSTLDVINFKRLLREAHRQQVAAAPASVEATTIPRKRQRKLQASDRKRARARARECARGGGDCAQIPLYSRIHS